MPPGHTDKQTLTPYRLALLRRLPVLRADLTQAENRQMRECWGFGWVDVRYVGARVCAYEITPVGRQKLDTL